ncbi:VOC family protein [Gordonia sp. CPCC 206044]|uniref:VOC family protein n=1 Tax=Gordonia sp. CPCC 206044 TaxID=3140793 RepID=UPI003AF37458
MHTLPVAGDGPMSTAGSKDAVSTGMIEVEPIDVDHRENLMIRGMHAMFYSSEDRALREFIRDKLQLPGSDTGDGWLIFDAPEADLGIHPTDGTAPPSGTADISFYCDHIEETVAQLKGRGVEFVGDIEDHGYGLVTHFAVPGGFTVALYEPRYTK